MKKKLCSIFLAAYLIAGCSSGGGINVGAGGGGFVTAGEFLLAAALLLTDTISIDTIQDNCGTIENPDFETFTTKTGTVTITITNITDLTNGLFPSGVLVESYSVSFFSGDPGAPRLTTRSFGATASTVNGENIVVQVIIADLGFTKPEFAHQNPGGTIFSYVVTVTVRGRTLSGDAFNLSASSFAEMGNFDNCSSNT